MGSQQQSQYLLMLVHEPPSSWISHHAKTQTMSHLPLLMTSTARIISNPQPLASAVRSSYWEDWDTCPTILHTWH